MEGALANRSTMVAEQPAASIGPQLCICSGGSAFDYCASKAGVLGVKRATALDHATKNNRVNAIMPAVIETPVTKEGVFKVAGIEQILLAQYPIGRFGRAEEVASAVLFHTRG